MNNKTEIRKFMLAKRRGFVQGSRDLACGYVCDQLLKLGIPKTKVIAGYVAIHGEVDISQALAAFHLHNNPICLPTVTEAELILKFLKWTPEDVMVKGPHGILEPMGGEVLQPDVLIVPLVAFDRRGYRLGYGGGYYDATIAHLRAQNPALQTIGVGYSFQEVAELPHEEHDMALDIIVTESEVIHARPRDKRGA